MLHFEYYSETLGLYINKNLSDTSDPFCRRSDLSDPFEILNEGYKNTLKKQNQF